LSSRALDEQADVGGHEAGWHVIDRVERALRKRAQLAHDVVAAGDVATDQGQPQLIGRPLREAEADLGDALLGDQTEHSARVGRDLLQDLEPLAGERPRVDGHAREIVAGGGVARNQSRADRIADPREHDRDRRRRGLGGHRVRGADGDDHVGLRRDQRLGLRLDVGAGALRVLDQQGEVGVLVPELTQSFAESLEHLAEAQPRCQHGDLDRSSGRCRVRGDGEARRIATATTTRTAVFHGLCRMCASWKSTL
jgi:hypothetical protein